jgi:hypothetical protein
MCLVLNIIPDLFLKERNISQQFSLKVEENK